MRFLLAFLVFCAACQGAFAQGYTPRRGETVMSVAIEGRGTIHIRLFTDEAPRTTSHIIALAERGFYNDQRFYRVVTSPKPFLIQTGDPASKTREMNDPKLGQGGSGSLIPYEASGKPNVEGAVGLSHPQGQKNAGDSQFYVLLSDSRFLDGSYTVFGQIVAGMDVVKSVELGDKVTSVTIHRG